MLRPPNISPPSTWVAVAEMRLIDHHRPADNSQKAPIIDSKWAKSVDFDCLAFGSTESSVRCNDVFWRLGGVVTDRDIYMIAS
jgi:hypothetical protein